MRKILLLIFFSCGSLVSAGPLVDCSKMEKKQLEIEITVSNIENRETTHTPEGGPYKPRQLVCQDEVCIILTVQKTILKHLPGHPDSNAEGYVQLPEIDLYHEIEKVITAKGEYESLARNCRAIHAANAKREAIGDGHDERINK